MIHHVQLKTLIKSCFSIPLYRLQCLPLVRPINEVDVVWLKNEFVMGTVTVIEPYKSLPTTTLIRYSIYQTISRVFEVHCGKRPIRNLRPCSEKTLTLLFFLVIYSTCGRKIIVWRLAGGILINIIFGQRLTYLHELYCLGSKKLHRSSFKYHKWHQLVYFFSLFYLFHVSLFLWISLIYLLDPRSTIMLRTTSLPNCFAFRHLEKWSLRISKTSFLWPTTKCARLRWKKILLDIPSH